MNIQDILDILDDMIAHAWSLPLSGGRCVIDAEKAKDLIYDIRANLPREIREAQSISEDKKMIVANAHKEAELIIRRAEERAKALVANDELVRQAQERATEILTVAQQKAREMQRAAYDFSDDCLESSEQALTEGLSKVKATRAALKKSQK